MPGAEGSIFKKAIAVLVLGLILIIYLIIPLFLTIDTSQQLSAWDDDYDDLSTMRNQVEGMDIIKWVTPLGEEKDLYDLDDPYDVRSIVTGPEILTINSVIPEDTLYIITGLERPLSQNGIDGLKKFVKNGGHVIIADNSDNVRGLASQFGVTMYPGKFYDESYDKNSSYTKIDARLGVDRMTPKYLPNFVEENMIMDDDDNPWPDGIWDDDTDGDGKIDEDPLEDEFVPPVDDDKDSGKMIADGIDNDNDWQADDGGYDESGDPIDAIGYEEGYNEDIIDDDGDGREDEEWLNGIDDDGDGLIDEDLLGHKILLSDPSGMSSIGGRIIAHGSVNSYVDMNGDGKITTPKAGDPEDQLIDAISSPGSEIQLIVEVVVSPDNGQPLDLTGFTEKMNPEDPEGDRIRKVQTVDLGESIVTHDMKDVHEFGSIIFIADSSIFINDLVNLDHITYDYMTADPYDIMKGKDEGPDEDDNGLLDNSPDGIPDYDNARFFRELVYYFLPDGGVVIFDESRHSQNDPFMIPIYSTINTVVFLTSDPIYAGSLFFITALILGLAVIITRDKENWVHKFDTSLFKGRQSIPESRRDKARILRKAVLEKVRLGRSLAPEEFAQLSPKVVDSFIRDPQLIELVRNESKEYSDPELGALSEKIMAFR